MIMDLIVLLFECFKNWERPYMSLNNHDGSLSYMDDRCLIWFHLHDGKIVGGSIKSIFQRKGPIGVYWSEVYPQMKEEYYELFQERCKWVFFSKEDMREPFFNLASSIFDEHFIPCIDKQTTHFL